MDLIKHIGADFFKMKDRLKDKLPEKAELNSTAQTGDPDIDKMLLAAQASITSGQRKVLEALQTQTATNGKFPLRGRGIGSNW